MIFETHAHYNDAKFDTDREAVLAELPESGVSPVINVGDSIRSTKETLAVAGKKKLRYAEMGEHPSEISGLNEETFAWLS